MKKLIYILAFIIASSSAITAQKIETKKVFGGYVFSQNDKTINLMQMKKLMKDNKEAFELVQSAKTNQTWGMILSGAGGALVGFPAGTAIAGGDPEWVLAGAGVALIVATIPIMKNFNRKTKKAVELYNAEITASNYSFQPTFNVNIKGLGLGIAMSF